MTPSGDLTNNAAGEIFRDVIGRFATGVTVLTTRSGGRDFGTTASAVSSLSLEPPMLLVCLNQTSETRAAIAETGSFSVNILGEEQSEIASRFASKSSTKFAGVGTFDGVTGLPLLTGALAHLECRVAETATGGTHTVFLAEVVRAEARDGLPLTYYQGRFGRFEDARQEEAYRLVRRLILSREIPAGSTIDVGALATRYGLEPARANYALTKLLSDGLVSRESQRGHRVTPLDAAAADEALVARSALEVAVLESFMGELSAGQIGQLETHAEAACQAIAVEPRDVSRLASASIAFHETLIGLSDNTRLIDFYHRLRISTIWMRVLPKGEFVDPSYLRTLAAACRARDREAARQVILRHRDEVRAIARQAIARCGGAL